MLKKQIIAVVALAFLLAACLPAANVAVDAENNDTVEVATATPLPVMPDEDESMDSDGHAEEAAVDEEDDAAMAADESVQDMPAAEEPTVAAVPYDFLIEPYQGFDSDAPMLIDVFANGKPTIVNFFASGCPICVAEMGHLYDAHAEFGDQVNFVAIDIGPYVRLGTNEEAVALLEEYEITFPAGTTADSAVLREYSVLGTPTTVFFNRDGSINQRITGFLSSDQFATLIGELK